MRSQLYLQTVSALGLLVIGHCVSTLIQDPVDFQWIALAILALFTGSLTIRIPGVAARLSVSETFVFASVLLFGTCAGTVTVALEVLVAVSGIRGKKATDPQRVLFNVAAGALSIWIAGSAFYLVAGIPPLSVKQTELQNLVVPLGVLSAIDFLLNSGLIAIALAFQRSESAIAIWRTNFSGLAINYFAGASLAALFVSYTVTIDLFALSVFVPLLLVSYLTFKSSLARIEDANRHVEEVNRLYLSTIETLATAIDAKDQVTHGHIRRVQQLALALAGELGVKDKLQLKALEASALLHDTGKLAIPEHILNKPGKLTTGEFEKMKQHAHLGAEILSSISFPYPVVPIVRHHHENWDGTGYPDGLKGTAIPVGARILAVVDCFDALTSDRPYRPKMSDEDAIAILIQRRGTMYDPLVVDTFVGNIRRLTAQIDAAQEPVARPTPHPKELPIIANQPSGPVRGRWDAVLDNALRQTRSSVAILFGVDRDQDCLTSIAVKTASGPAHEVFTMPLGFGMSGWVAANCKAILNADASLDFRGRPPLTGLVRSTSVPIVVRDHAVGVLSLYTDDPRGFTAEDGALLDELARKMIVEDPTRHFDAMLRTKQPTAARPSTVH